MRYSYQIQVANTQDDSWDIADPNSFGTEDYDGSAYDYGREILDSHYDLNPDHPTVQDEAELRVLVWIADSEEVGSESDAVAVITADNRDKPAPEIAGLEEARTLKFYADVQARKALDALDNAIQEAKAAGHSVNSIADFLHPALSRPIIQRMARQ